MLTSDRQQRDELNIRMEDPVHSPKCDYLNYLTIGETVGFRAT
jgi:hypothetical protein